MNDFRSLVRVEYGVEDGLYAREEGCTVRHSRDVT